MPGWKSPPMRDDQWKLLPNATILSRSLEQDHAAGGRNRRAVAGSNGAIGRVILRCRYRRVYAELRWQTGQTQRTTYLCQVQESTRAANLAVAWNHAHQQGLTGPSDR